MIILGDNVDVEEILFLLLFYEVSIFVFFDVWYLVLELNFLVFIKMEENFLIEKWRLLMLMIFFGYKVW